MTLYKRVLTFVSVLLISVALSFLTWIGDSGDDRLAAVRMVLSILVVSGIVLFQVNASHDRAELARLLKEAHREQERLRTTDRLTGLRNREHFHDELSRESDRCLMGGRPLAIMLIDVDDFTSINDQHGLDVGDVILTDLAQRFRKVARHRDVLARHGGQEFAMLLPGTREDEAIAIGERLRQGVGESTVVASASLRIPVTVSVGVAAATGRAEISPENLIARADRALRRAKEFGRDRVVCARLPVPQYTNPAEFSGRSPKTTT